MMKISSMRLIVDPLEANKALPEIVDLAARRWSTAPQPTAYVRSSTTFVFTFCREGRHTILRLQLDSDTTMERIVSELAYLRHVSDSGIVVADYLPSLRAEAVEVIRWGGRTFFATAFDYISGENIEFEAMTLGMIENWGATTARIHEASREFALPPEFALPTWEGELDQLGEFVPDAEKRTLEELTEVQRWLYRRPASDANFGLIHRDLEPDNMKWDGEQFVVYDFNDAMFHFFAADVASALEEPVESGRGEERVERFLVGYSSVRDASDIRVEDFPKFYRAARLRKYLRLLASYSDTGPADEPTWLVGMRSYHEGVISKLRESIAISFDWS